MKIVGAILLTFLIGLSGPRGAGAPLPSCETDAVTQAACCCSGCTCSASESPASDPLPAVPTSTQQLDTRSSAATASSELSQTFQEPKLLTSTAPAFLAFPEHVPLFQRHCSLLR